MVFFAPIRLGCLLLAAALGLSSCGSTGDAVSKVKIFRLNPSARINSNDPALDFERRHYLHGALTAEEVASRSGNYYKVFWSVADRATPVVLRFEYRQALTGSKVHVIEQTVDAPKHSNLAEFQVTGESFAKQGKVIAWRVLIQRGKQTLASRESYLWQ